ncbi:regulatory solute carrier protein family 1 member 1 [Tenrec ecaudatus]|uniref:regulatory solute carrier protein family 1 member 1 n=1 Tax=Tenrec ecaudatus TaxID=94439 RepID=UPI003F59F9CE
MGNHAGLARCVSASVCPIKPSDPESLEPRAARAVEASAEFQMSSEKREHLLPQQVPSDGASSADSAPAGQSPTLPSQKSSEEAIVADTPKKSPAETSTQGLKFHLCERRESSLSVTTARMHDPHAFLLGKSWHPEHQHLSQVNDLQEHEEEPGDAQHEAVDQNVLHEPERLCNTGGPELLGEGQQNQQKCVALEAETKEGRLQLNVDLLGTQKNPLPSGCFDSSNSETLMEVDVVEQSRVAVFNSAGSQNTDTLHSPLMEVETAMYNHSSEILSNSISTQDLQLPENSVEMSSVCKECGHSFSSLSLCGSCPSSVESAEEPYSSVTAALKELHELLVISSNPASENTAEEVFGQSETATIQAETEDLSERWAQRKPLPATQDKQPPHVPGCQQTVSVPVNTEKMEDTSPAPGMEGVENGNFRGPGGDGLPADTEAVSKSRESASESSSVPTASAETSNQLHCTTGAEISPTLSAGEEDSVYQTCAEQMTSLPLSFVLVRDLGQGIQNPVADRPEAREDVCPEAASPFLEREPSASLPSSPSFLPPLVFPAADIDRILRAGFTLQEALGALRRVDGNADLALLVLLAKNIVVPT